MLTMETLRPLKTAFVTGACGFIGRFLCRLLVQEGVEVRALVRNRGQKEVLAGLPITWIDGDLANVSALHQGMAGADTVFHIAALFRATRFDPVHFWDANVEGTRRILQIAEEAGVKGVVHCSTTGVLGDVQCVPAREDTPYAPLDLYQKTKAEAEILALDFFRRGRLNGAVIRPAMVWGPEDTRLFKLFKGVASRRLPCIGDGSTWCHWVHVEDVAKGFFLAATRLVSSHSVSNGKVYTLGGEVPLSILDTMKLIAAAYGVSLLPFKVPLRPIQLLGDITEVCCKPLGIEPPLHRRRVDFFAKNRCFDCSAAVTDLGYSPTRSLVDEILQIARWYVTEGWLAIPAKNRDHLFSSAAIAALGAAFAECSSLSQSAASRIALQQQPVEASNG